MGFGKGKGFTSIEIVRELYGEQITISPPSPDETVKVVAPNKKTISPPSPSVVVSVA